MMQQAPPQQSMLGSMGSTMVSGMAFGAGSEAGHMAIKSMFGGSSSSPAPVKQEAPVAAAAQPTGPCAIDQSALQKCLQTSSASSCDFYFQALQSCQANNGL